ncbi:MAG: hypothetical protein IC227_05430 [Enterococcus lacertideformus]|uniref:Uncharacterized protein n=1 Tax=Enterococcus lacertideformus TaxID=2771493 RepID=A0A931F8I4_9ENTE|nr:hypothetical protein [Enterococcus lacertideformus]
MFEQLSNQNLSIGEILLWLKQNQIEHFEELIFPPSLTELKNSFYATAPYNLLREKEFEQLLNQFQLVARTIDGDYLLANDKQVLLFPRSHQPEDFLYFFDTFSNLLIKYENSIQSISELFEK